MKGKHNERRHMRRIFENLRADKCYTKGIRDSKSKDIVLASRVGNYFSTDTCYLDYVKNLPYGTCYVDGE